MEERRRKIKSKVYGVEIHRKTHSQTHENMKKHNRFLQNRKSFIGWFEEENARR